jgi:hypothetical protein
MYNLVSPGVKLVALSADAHELPERQFRNRRYFPVLVLLFRLSALLCINVDNRMEILSYFPRTGSLFREKYSVNLPKNSPPSCACFFFLTKWL